MYEKEKLLVTSNFSSSNCVFKRHVKNQGLFGKGLKEILAEEIQKGRGVLLRKISKEKKNIYNRYRNLFCAGDHICIFRKVKGKISLCTSILVVKSQFNANELNSISDISKEFLYYWLPKSYVPLRRAP